MTSPSVLKMMIKINVCNINTVKKNTPSNKETKKNNKNINQ